MVFRYRSIYMRARNFDVADKLSAKYAQLRGRTDTSGVFCVANKDYEGHEFNSISAHREAIKASGIPELRRFCRTIVAQAQFAACNYFLHFEIENLMQSTRGWLEAATRTTPPPPLDHILEPAQQVSYLPSSIVLSS